MENEPSPSEVYLSFAPEVLQLLNRSGTSVEELLRKASITDIRQVANPVSAPGHRDFLTICIGSAAVIAAATPMITSLVRALVNKPVVARRTELAPALDGKGNPIRDAQGKPVMRWTDATSVDRAPDQSNLNAFVAATTKGVEIGLGG